MSNATTVGPIELQDILVGLSYTVVCLVQTLFYIPCLIVIRTDQELKSLSCFRMMFHLGLSDMCNMFCQATAGILIMTRWAYSMPYWVNRVYGAFHSAFSWNWYIILINVIAFNRCIIICMPEAYKMTLFSDKATTFWLAGCFAYAVVWWLVLLAPKSSFILIPEVYTFYYDDSYEWYEQVKTAAWYCDNIFLNGSIVWYIIVFVYMRSQSNLMTSGSEQQIDTRVKERKILYQAALIGLYTMVANQYWHLVPYVDFAYSYYVGNMYWISCSAINPLVYMTLNKTIKQKVSLMISGNNNATVHPLTAAGRSRGARSSNRIRQNETLM